MISVKLPLSPVLIVQPIVLLLNLPELILSYLVMNVLECSHKVVHPDDYPAIGTEITVVGKFNYYKEGFYTYCQLTDATMAADET